MVSLFKSIGTQMDLLVPESKWSDLVGFIRHYPERTGIPLRYEREEKVGENQVKLIGVEGTPKALSELVFWMMNTADSEDSRNFYILMRDKRKRGPKNVRKNREKAGQGSNGGDHHQEAVPATGRRGD